MPLAMLGVPVLRLPRPCIVSACAPWFLHGLPPFASVTLLSVDALTLRASRARLQLFACYAHAPLHLVLLSCSLKCQGGRLACGFFVCVFHVLTNVNAALVREPIHFEAGPFFASKLLAPPVTFLRALPCRYPV